MKYEVKKLYMKRNCLLFLNIFICVFPIYAEEPVDSIKSRSLDEVIVQGDNIYRDKDHLNIIPTENQKKQAQNGYGLLYNLMIPGLNINNDGTVNTMGFPTGLYINGQPASTEDIRYLYSKDVVRIELYDAPTGQFAKDNMALNFILKKFNYGGYVSLFADQSLGNRLNSGNYRVATSYNKNDITYSLFGGYGYSTVKDIKRSTSEVYSLLDETVFRNTNSSQNINQKTEYFQFQTRFQNKSSYIIGKLTFLGRNNPENKVFGETFTNVYSETPYNYITSSKSYSPRLDINAQFKFNNEKKLDLGLHTYYSRNENTRQYLQSPYAYYYEGRENAGNLKLGAIYTQPIDKGTFTAELYENFDIFQTHYNGEYSSNEKLWQNSSLLFAMYNYPFSDKVTGLLRLGAHWEQYKLTGESKKSIWHPRMNIRVTSRLPKGMLLWYFMLANPSYNTNVLNNSIAYVNPYLITTGNPNLKGATNVDTYFYYSLPIRQFNITVLAQYQFAKNLAVNTYTPFDDYIIQSYLSSGTANTIMLDMATTYRPSNSFALAADIKYMHKNLKIPENYHNNNFSCSLGAQWYIKNFMIMPRLNYSTPSFDYENFAINNAPLNYNLRLSYSYKGFIAAATVFAPFAKRKIDYSIATPYYSSDVIAFNPAEYQNVSIELSYSFDYGRKVERVEKDIDESFSSSMLKDT